MMEKAHETLMIVKWKKDGSFNTVSSNDVWHGKKDLQPGKTVKLKDEGGGPEKWFMSCHIRQLVSLFLN